MPGRITKYFIVSVLWIVAGTQTYAAIILNQGFMTTFNQKSTIAVDNKANKILLKDENFAYPGFMLGLDVPFMPNSIGLVSTIGMGFGSKKIRLNQYNIETYEYRIKQADGNTRNTINTDGNLLDKNLQEKISNHMKDNGGDYITETTELVIVSSVLFRYSFPVEMPFKQRPFEITSMVLNYINPYIAAGFSNIIIDRKLKLNSDISQAITDEHGAAIIKDGEEIQGKDPSPDPDFYLTWGFGFNVVVPQLKFLGTQIVFTLEATFHYSLSPGDQDRPFDDAYIMGQGGQTLRFAVGTLL